MAEFQYLAPYGVAQPGSPVQRGAGGMGVYHDELDMRRSAARAPQAEFPSGYLGAYRSRREDRLLDSLRNRANQRSYQRGVHKGVMVDPGDYFWPPDFNPQTSLEYQAQGMKYAPLGVITPTSHVAGVAPPTPHLTNDGKPGPRGSQSLLEVNPFRAADMQRFKTPWR